jgi:nucleoside-diphosphate-sugar epimerase
MKRVLITGAGGQVAFPLARSLVAAGHEVWGLARLRRPGERERLEAAGIRPFAADLGAADFDGLPRDFDQVLHFAVAKSGKWDRDLAANAEGLGLLMAHCRESGALLHCSSTAVYEPAGHTLLTEKHALGDNHRAFMPTYSICKIAAEVVARTAARTFAIPTTIARLNVPYGDGGARRRDSVSAQRAAGERSSWGWPAIHLEQVLAGTPIAVSPESPNTYNPIHEDDIIAMVPRLLDVASVPATVVNWGGSEASSIEEWSAYLGVLTGKEPRFVTTERTIGPVAIDVTRMHELVGATRVRWRDGMRRMVAARHPEIALSCE